MAPGALVPFGPYLLTGRLGQGGMGELFAARQRGVGHFDRGVVLKLVRPDIPGRLADATAMLLDEARIAAQVCHPNVVSIYEVGQVEGAVYVAMEHLDGISLHALQRQVRDKGLRLPPDLAAALVAQVCAGLAAIHGLAGSDRPPRVIHRDISPSNLICLPGGWLKIIDFGIARADDRIYHTADPAALKGNPAYIAPEQVRGEPVDARADLFATGVLLYELCSGEPLFAADTIEASLYNILQKPVPLLRSVRPDVPGLLEDLIHEAIARDPAARPQSAAAFAERLNLVVEREGGRFAAVPSIARYYKDNDLVLSGPPPIPLGGPPLLLRHPPGPPDVAPPPCPPAARAQQLRTVDLPAGSATLRHEQGAAPLVILTQEIDAHRATAPFLLRLSELPGLLPAPLYLSQQASSISLQARPTGGERLGLYLDARRPATRLSSCTLDARADGLLLELGHRRSWTTQVRCYAVGAEAPAADLALDVLGLRIACPRPARRLVAIAVPERAGAATYVNCVTIL